MNLIHAVDKFIFPTPYRMYDGCPVCKPYGYNDRYVVPNLTPKSDEHINNLLKSGEKVSLNERRILRHKESQDTIIKGQLIDDKIGIMAAIDNYTMWEIIIENRAFQNGNNIGRGEHRTNV